MQQNPKRSAFKAVLLDLGGVVFQSSGISNVQIQWPVITQLNYKYGHELNVGADLFPNFLRDYNQMTQQQLEGSRLLKLIFDSLEFNEELLALLGSQFPIIIASDNYRENIEYISQRFKFNQWAVAQFYSFDLALEKTDPGFFTSVLERIPYKADDLLFIDDSPHKIAAAQQVGIQGIVYRDNKQIRDYLGSLE